MIESHSFRPRRWLGNGHLQTIAGNFSKRQDRLPSPATEMVAVPLPPELEHDPRAIELNRVLPSRVLCHTHLQNDPARPAVILVHGLEGSSHSHYIVGNANKLWHAGFHVVRMNMRNCGSTDALSPMLYHSGLSGDLLAVLDWLGGRCSGPVALAGYSMGGNLVLKAAGELGNAAPANFACAVAVSPPADLAESADAIHHPSNRLYEQRFMRNLKARYRRKVRLFPAVFKRKHLDTLRSIRDFDDAITAPYCGFRDASDYYARSASARVADRIAVPTLVLHAEDDPFVRLTPATRNRMQNNRNIQLLVTQRGGHCAFLEDAAPGYDGHWAEKMLLSFVSAHTRQPRLSSSIMASSQTLAGSLTTQEQGAAC